MIKNLLEMCDEVGCGPSFSSLRKSIYRGTSSGVSVRLVEGGLAIQGYAEGSEGECEVTELEYPFDKEEFWAVVEDCNSEASEAWDEANPDFFDHCESDDNAQRAADMNSVLFDIGRAVG